MDFVLQKLSFAPLEEELLRKSLSYLPDPRTESQARPNVFQALANAFTALSDEKCDDDKDKMEITSDDFHDIVEQLRDKGVWTTEGVKQICIQNKIEKGNNNDVRTVKKEENNYFPENFLTQAARKAASAPPLIRVDEWNDNSKKWHKHGLYVIDQKVDDEAKSAIDGRCQTKTSAISDVLNNSVLGDSLDYDRNNEELFEESTPSSNWALEYSKRRNFLFTVSQNLGSVEFSNKSFLVTIEDESMPSLSYEVGSRTLDDSMNISLRNLHSMRLSAKRNPKKGLLVSVKELDFIEE